MRRTLLVVFVLLVAAAGLTAAKRPRQWQTGKLMNVGSEDKVRLVYGTSHRYEVWTYTIDDGKFVWDVGRELHLRGDSPLDVTVNTPVKFAIEGHDCFLQDEHEKEHKLFVLKKTLKE